MPPRLCLSSTASHRASAIPARRGGGAAGLDGLDAVGERLGQRALPEGAKEACDHPPPQVLALADQHDVEVGLSVGPRCQEAARSPLA
jgi:hypothetical protein